METLNVLNKNAAFLRDSSCGSNNKERMTGRYTGGDRGVTPRANFDRKLKGFTLVELLIVIAIIGVLGSISAWAISAYMRNASMQRIQQEARMGLTAVQNCLVNWEINPRMLKSVLMIDDDYEYVGPTPGPVGTPVNKVILSFYISDGIISNEARTNPGGTAIMGGNNYSIAIRYNDHASAPVMLTNGASDDNRDAYLSLARQLQDSLGAGITGRYDVYFTLQNVNPTTGVDISYTVERAVFSPETNNLNSMTGAVVDGGASGVGRGTLLRINSIPGPTIFYYNMYDHTTDFRSRPDKYGCYPYLSEDPIGTPLAFPATAAPPPPPPPGPT